MNRDLEKSCCFFCEKYSDLENALPLIFEILDKKKVGSVYIFWFGDLISNQVRVLLDSVQAEFPRECFIFTPSLSGFLSYDCIRWRKEKNLTFYTVRLVQRLTKLFPLADFDEYHPRMTTIINRKIRDLMINNGYCFFGFYNRRVIEKLASENPSLKWIRIPQGAIISLSIYREVHNVVAPNLGPIKRYSPIYASAALTTDTFVREYYESNQIHTLGSPTLIPVGSVRYSDAWVDKLTQIIDKRPQLPPRVSRVPRILFLLTPFHKNVWREETERAVEIISSYPVELVVKGFHSNTAIDVKGKDNVFHIEDVTTPELIRASDFIFFIATSAAIEAFILGKETLQLSYLHANQTHLEVLDLGVRANSRDCLHKRMRLICETGTMHSVSSDARRHEAAVAFLREKVITKDPAKKFLGLFDADFNCIQREKS